MCTHRKHSAELMTSNSVETIPVLCSIPFISLWNYCTQTKNVNLPPCTYCTLLLPCPPHKPNPSLPLLTIPTALSALITAVSGVEVLRYTVVCGDRLPSKLKGGKLIVTYSWSKVTNVWLNPAGKHWRTLTDRPTFLIQAERHKRHSHKHCLWDVNIRRIKDINQFQFLLTGELYDSICHW